MEGILKEWLSSITEAINNLMRAEFNHARNQSRAETTALLGAAKWKLQEIEQGIKLALPSETVELDVTPEPEDLPTEEEPKAKGMKRGS